MGAVGSILLTCIDRLKPNDDDDINVNISCNCCNEELDEYLFKGSRSSSISKE